MSHKVLWLGDACCCSGFAKCTHAVCDELHSAGWDVNVLGINYFGDPTHNYPYNIFPLKNPLDTRENEVGLGRLPLLVDRLDPDIVVVLCDPCQVESCLSSLKEIDNPPPIVAWLAVDSCNQPGNELNGLSRAVVWTKFASEEIKLSGYEGEIDIVPLGVDLGIYYPLDKQASQLKVWPKSLSSESFVVGVVSRNQSRKRLDLTLESFAHWIDEYAISDAYLYFHVAPTKDRGFDIERLVKYYGLEGKVIASQLTLMAAHESVMPIIYSSFDITLSTTEGEGWGLPVLESMACGVPCIVPDYSGLGSWVGDSAYKVQCSNSSVLAPVDSRMYTIGRSPSVASISAALNNLYNSESLREKYSRRGIRLAGGLSWKNTGRRFRHVLESVLTDQIQAAA